MTKAIALWYDSDDVDRFHKPCESVFDVDETLDSGVFDTFAFTLLRGASAEPTFVSGIRVIIFAANSRRIFVKQKRVVHAGGAKTRENR